VVQLDDNGDALILEHGLTIGDCDLCDNTVNQHAGIQATVFGILSQEPGRGVGEPPVLTVTSVEAYDATACDAFYSENEIEDPLADEECLPNPEGNFCVSGFVMDTVCIEQGYYFDDLDANPLREPELHTVRLLCLGCCGVVTTRCGDSPVFDLLVSFRHTVCWMSRFAKQGTRSLESRATVTTLALFNSTRMAMRWCWRTV